MIQPRNMAKAPNAVWDLNALQTSYGFRYRGGTDADLFWVVPSTNRVGIGTSAPTAKLHVAGALTVDGLLTVSTGGVSFTGGLTLPTGNLTFGAASAKIIPGATSLLFRDTGDANTNLSITDAGVVTLRSNLVFSAASAKIIPGATSLLFRNTADGATNLSITDAGLVTVGVGNLAVTAGTIVMGAAASQIVPGATSLSFRNTAGSADNLIITDAGLVTVRLGVTIAAGPLIISAAAAQITGGATSLSLRNNANNADNVLVTDAGAVTVRAGVTVTAGGLAVSAGRTALSGPLNLAAVGTALAVGSNTITPTKSFHTVDSSGGAVTVKTITAGTDGDLLTLQPNHATNDVVFDNTGNLRVGNAGSRTLTNQQDTITLVYSAALTRWVEVGFATNA